MLTRRPRWCCECTTDRPRTLGRRGRRGEEQRGTGRRARPTGCGPTRTADPTGAPARRTRLRRFRRRGRRELVRPPGNARARSRSRDRGETRRGLRPYCRDPNPWPPRRGRVSEEEDFDWMTVQHLYRLRLVAVRRRRQQPRVLHGELPPAAPGAASGPRRRRAAPRIQPGVPAFSVRGSRAASVQDSPETSARAALRASVLDSAKHPATSDAELEGSFLITPTAIWPSFCTPTCRSCATPSTTLPRGRLALRGHHRDVRPAAGRVRPLWSATACVAGDHVRHADAGGHAHRPAAAVPLRPPHRQPPRAGPPRDGAHRGRAGVQPPGPHVPASASACAHGSSHTSTAATCPAASAASRTAGNWRSSPARPRTASCR